MATIEAPFASIGIGFEFTFNLFANGQFGIQILFCITYLQALTPCTRTESKY